MDTFAAVLADHRAQGAFVLRSDLRPPWAIRVEDEAPLTIVVVVRGSAVLVVDGDEAVELAAGGAALVVGGVRYTVSDRVGTPSQALIGVGQRCSKPDGSPLSEFRDLGVRRWGNAQPPERAETVLLTGTYEHRSQVGHRLLGSLPPVLVCPGAQAGSAVRAVVDLLSTELAVGLDGQGAVLDRLLDLLVVALVRDWFDRSGSGPAWHAAAADPVLEEVLRRMHHEPARPWTLSSLARDVGVSRATLARRFTDTVGVPPMTYLTRWRLDVAADLLTSTGLTVEAVAARVGYGGAFALSAAFARRFGSSPGAYRREAASARSA